MVRPSTLCASHTALDEVGSSDRLKKNLFIRSRERRERVEGRTNDPMSEVPFHAGPPRLRSFGAVNWIGLWTLYVKEVRRFLKVFMQTVAAPVVTTLLFLAVFVLALGGGGRQSS